MEEQMAILTADRLQASLDNRLEEPAPTILFPEHGGDLQKLEDYFQGPPEQILDFSVCLNPMGPPQILKQTILDAFTRTQSYPSPEAVELKERLAGHHHLNTDNFLVTHGSTQLIYALPELWSPAQSVCIISPCFSEYEKAFKARGIDTRYYVLDSKNNFELNWEQLLPFLNSIPNLGGIVLGHPTTPAGALCGMDFLKRLLDFSRDHGHKLVIDETFVDFTDRGQTLPEILPGYSDLILIRSFSKFFSIPGIRLGYGITSQALAKKLKPFIPPWSAGALEIAAGVACLDESEYFPQSRQYLANEKDYLACLLNSLKEVKTFSSESCFLLFELTGNRIKSEQLFTSLLQDGILIRNCGNFRGLNPRFFRIGIRTREENKILARSMKQHLE